MSTLPDPPRPEPDEPPVVALLRDRLRRSPRARRLAAVARRHRMLAALAGSAVAVWKFVRVLVPLALNRDMAAWMLGHWLLVIGAAAVVAAGAFVSVRLGIDWADRWVLEPNEDGAAPSRLALGPAWAERPHDASATYLPRGGN